MSDDAGFLPIEALDEFERDIAAQLVLAEMQLKSLRYVFDKRNLSSEVTRIESLLRDNHWLEQEIPKYSGQLAHWRNQELSPTQHFEVKRLVTILNRLTIVNAKIIQLSRSQLRYLDQSKVTVDAFLQRLSKNS